MINKRFTSPSLLGRAGVGLLLLLFTVQTTWAQAPWTLEGDGTETSPFLISSTADWQKFARMVNTGYTFDDQYFRMTADIDAEGVSVGGAVDGPVMAAFCGIFDGDGHTLTYNRGVTSSSGSLTYVDEYCAPFILLKGATIRHLNVTGSIYSDHKQGAGIASLIDGSKPTTLMDCHVSSLLNAGSKLSGDACFGGLVGYVPPTCTASHTITDCSFTGSIVGWADRTGGLVGFTHQPIKFEDCLFDPAETPYSNDCATLARMVQDGTCTFKDCYYTMKMGASQGTCIFTEVSVPEGCKAELIGEPFKRLNGKKYYRSGAQVELTVPEGTQFDHWLDNNGCFVSDPWTAGGVHTLSDVKAKPLLAIITSMPEPVQGNRKLGGIIYRYLSKRDCILFMSDSLRQARGYRFDDDGECFVFDKDGTKNWVTVVWSCDASDQFFKTSFRDGWFWEDDEYEGTIIHNDLVAESWEHTHLFAIAPRAFQNVKELKRLVFISNGEVHLRSDCQMQLDVMIQEQAFKDSGLEELIMMYYNRAEKDSKKKWSAIGPKSGVTIAADAFEGTDCRISVDPSVYQEYMADQDWSPHYGHFNIYAAKLEDMKVEGAIYSYWRNSQSEPLKNNDAGHKSLMDVLKYWNADYQQFNAASLLSTSSKNIWYTQVIGADDSYLKSHNGVMRIYNDPGSQYNYKTLAIQSLGQSKEVKAIEFYQTNGLSDNSYSDLKLVIPNGAFKGCDNLKELRLFYYVEDGEDRWTALGPKDVVPGNNIFGVPSYAERSKMTEEEGKTASHIPVGFRILVSPELYPQFLDDPNWASYIGLIEPVDYAPSAKKDITKDGLSYGFMTNPGGITQTSQTVSQDVSWWTAPRIAIEIAMLVATVGLSSGASAAEQSVQVAFAGAMSAAEDEAECKALIQMCNLTSELLEIGVAQPEYVANLYISAAGQTFAKEVFHALPQEVLSFFTEMGWIVGDHLFYNDFSTGLSQVITELSAETIKGMTTVLQEAATRTLTNSLKATAEVAMMRYNDLLRQYAKAVIGKSIAKVIGSTAVGTSTAGLIASACWGGSGTYNGDMMQKGMRANILSNIHQVGLLGGGYVITTPSKNLLYHMYVKNVADETKDAVIYAGFDDDNNSYTSDRTMTFAKKAFQNHKNLRTVSFHSMEGQSSNAAMPMLLTIPDSAFVGCDNLVEFSTLLADNEKGTRPLGPENFILAGDSIFAGLDSLKFHIVIDPSRKQDFLDNESWAPLKRFFTYRDAQPKAKYNVYGGQYAYSYENNSIKREHKVSGHLIEHTEVVGADNEFLDEHQGALKLCNDIGRFDNFQIDAVRYKAFMGNEHLRVVNFTDLYGAGAFGDSYTGLEMELGDSCFANCKNLANLDLLYLVTDGDNHIDAITPQQVKIGKGVFDGTDARIKMMPQQVDWFLKDSAWAEYKDRFMPCIIKPADEGVKEALKDMPYYDMAHTGNDWKTWDDYIDLARIAGVGFSWLDNKFREQRDDIRSFPDFKQFASVGLTYVGKEWFHGCRKMTNILLPETIKTIQEYAFASCSSLQEIELPDGLVKIENCAFADCQDMKTIVVNSATPARLGDNAFPKNEGMKIYVPAESLNDYLKAWAEYKDYIVGDEYKVNKVVKLDKMGTLAEKLGLIVEWDYSGLYAGDEPRYIHGNFTKYDSLTVSGPMNAYDLWVIRYLAGNSGYEKRGISTDGQMRYLNLYDASIKKDDNCEAHFYNSGGVGNGWIDLDEDDVVPTYLFYGCTPLETVILPKTTKKAKSYIFEGCPRLKRLAVTSAWEDYEDWLSLGYMIDAPLDELVFYADGHARSSCKDPWGQPINSVYTTKAQWSNYMNDPCIIAQTQNVVAPFDNDVVWDMLVNHGEFFPSVFFEKEDVGTIFSERNKDNKVLNTFDEFQYFSKVKELHGTFRADELLTSVSLPASVELIGEDVFEGCRSLKTITMKGDSVPKLTGDPFKSLPADYVIYVPRNAVKAYRTKWADYASHINPEGTTGGNDEIITVTLTEPNTLAEKLGLTATKGGSWNKTYDWITGVSGNYSKITKLKVIGPISGGDLSLLRYLSGFCPWSNTRNYMGHLEYIDLYDAQLKKSKFCVASDMHYKTTRDLNVFEDNVLPAYSFLQAYNLRTLILPKTCKKVQSRALQQCEYMETLVIGDDMEEFNWNALDDNASLTRMYILANKKVKISTEFAIWRWLCNNYNPTFEAFYVRPSQYEDYLMDDAYTGSSWQRTNNISTGVFTDDDDFRAFASHATATVDELLTVSSVDGWFDAHPNVKDLTPLRYTMVDTLSKATLAPLTKLEKVALPVTLTGMENGLFENAKGLRYAEFLFCDSTEIVSQLRDGGFKRFGIDTERTLAYVPATYGESDGTNIVAETADGKFHAMAYRMIDTLDYVVPYAFQTDTIINTRALPVASVPYTVCVPYKMNVPAYARAYQLSERSGNNLIFREVTGELEPMRPYLVKVVGNKRLRKTSTTLNTGIDQTVPANGATTYGRQDDAPGYSVRGTFEGIDNATAHDLGAYILQSDGDWHRVLSSSDAEKKAAILPFRAYLLPSTHYNGARIGMTLEDADDVDGIDTIETIDRDGTERYYDLNGRQLPGKPSRGMYIYNGKKYVSK